MQYIYVHRLNLYIFYEMYVYIDTYWSYPLYRQAYNYQRAQWCCLYDVLCMRVGYR